MLPQSTPSPVCNHHDCGLTVRFPYAKLGRVGEHYCQRHAWIYKKERTVQLKSQPGKILHIVKQREPYINKQGYRYIVENGRYKAEHTVIMERKLGRSLRKGESVHHKNGIRHDNDPDNLELWVGPIRSGQRASDLVCPHCGVVWGEG